MALSQLISKYSVDSNISISVHTFESPVGKLIGAADDNCLYMVACEDSSNKDKMFKTLCNELSCHFIEKKNNVLEKLEEELNAYFKGNLKKFTVPVKTIGSEFQKEVWEKLQELPYGSTQTYGDLAKVMGRPVSHSRAIGAACGANAHLLVIPCHRLVASASKGGFSCGVNRKEWLLEHEKKNIL